MNRLSDHEKEIENFYFKDGLSYQQIANKFGKSREAVRQFLNKNFPDRKPGTEFRKEQELINRTKIEEYNTRRNAKNSRPCVVCLGPVYKGNRKTCSHECAQLWPKVRYKLDSDARDKQRLSLANSIVKNEAKYTKSYINWANKIINGEPVNHIEIPERDSQSNKAMDKVMKLRANNGNG